jgi:predicted dehydrogenase
MKTITVSILGFGQRGLVYAEAIEKHTEEVKLVKVCEVNEKKHASVMERFHLSQDDIMLNEETFFEQKWSDILVISTIDKDHYRQVMKALDKQRRNHSDQR